MFDIPVIALAPGRHQIVSTQDEEDHGFVELSIDLCKEMSSPRLYEHKEKGLYFAYYYQGNKIDVRFKVICSPYIKKTDIQKFLEVARKFGFATASLMFAEGNKQ